MLTYTIKEIAAVTGGTIIQGNPAAEVNGLCTDSRRAKNGDIFVAMRGRQVDGHDFALKAIEQGATALLVTKTVTVPPQVAVIKVSDTIQALQQLAAHNRSRLNIPVVAVTGSNGKTSTKDMIAAVLNTRYKTLKTQGNYNNELGLPLTLLALDQTHQAAVVEMGMRGFGEIDLLARLAKPTGAVITNIGEAHLELLGSVQNIAVAKAEVLDHIGAEGFAILNGDSPELRNQVSRCQGQVWFYSINGQTDLVARNVRVEGRGVRYDLSYPGGTGEIYLPIPGSHNVMNSMAAVGVGLRLGIPFTDIVRGLAQVELTGMRLEIIKANNMTVINDVYNANPSSTKAALKVLAEVAPGRKIAVLGNMYELGALAESGHREVGEVAALRGVAQLVAVGDLARFTAQGAIKGGLPGDRVHHCDNNKLAIEVLRQVMQPGDTILVKGSRSMHMEEIVQALVNN